MGEGRGSGRRGAGGAAPYLRGAHASGTLPLSAGTGGPGTGTAGVPRSSYRGQAALSCAERGASTDRVVRPVGVLQ